MPQVFNIDPVTRIEGHYKYHVTVDTASDPNPGYISDVQGISTMFRGMENILKRRDPRDAPVICQRICGVCPTAHATAAVECVENTFGITPPDNGQVMRNISSTADFIMSHILHFYHLSALDFLDVRTATAGTGGPSVVMSPWAPQHLNGDSIGDVTGLESTRDILVGHYVQALEMRRKAHIIGAEVGGKHPCQNAQVPGGMTTKPSRVNWVNISNLIREIRIFINQIYIPDVLAAALCFGTPGLVNDQVIENVYPLPTRNTLNYNLFLQGFGCGRVLAYGGLPVPAAGVPMFDRGTARCTPGPGGTLTPEDVGATFNEALLNEHVAEARYSSPSQLHPSVGQTTPDYAGGYTWHKAPRYNNRVHEVGPLARMGINWATNGGVTVSEADIAAIPGDTLGILPSPGNLGAYNCRSLVNDVLTYLQNALTTLPGWTAPPGWTVPDPSLLFSILGRHAARALECKYLADALGFNVNIMTQPGPGPIGTTGGGGTSAGIPIIHSVIIDPAANSDVYTYMPMPKSLRMGRGMTEVPRGALGHWMTAEFRRIVNYQAVVPSTWNASGRDDLGNPGPAEQTLMGNPEYPNTALYTGYVGDGSTTADEMINRILRAIHPYDYCIACSVHVTDTKGNDIVKFTMNPDGSITKHEVETATVPE